MSDWSVDYFCQMRMVPSGVDAVQPYFCGDVDFGGDTVHLSHSGECVLSFDGAEQSFSVGHPKESPHHKCSYGEWHALRGSIGSRAYVEYEVRVDVVEWPLVNIQLNWMKLVWEE